MAAADAAGMPVAAWVEQALRQALEAKAEPAPPEGVEIDELEAMVRRVVAEELRPVQEALTHRLSESRRCPRVKPSTRSPAAPFRNSGLNSATGSHLDFGHFWGGGQAWIQNAGSVAI